MRSPFLACAISLLLIILVACTPGTVDNSTSETILDQISENDLGTTLSPVSTAVDPSADSTLSITEEPIILPISLYIVVGQDETLGSTRTKSDLEQIYQRVNDIWAPAGIEIRVQSIQKLELPDLLLRSILSGNFQPFFDGLQHGISVPNPSLLNGLYAQNIGGPNGIVPSRGRIFFVTDEPSVHDERVSAHEIGHILGLHHTLSDEGRLMFPGTNGMTLTEEEIVVARYVAQGFLDRMR